MRVSLVAVLAFAVSIFAVARVSRADGGDDELKKLNGTWKVVDEDVNGESQTKGLGRAFKVMVVGHSLAVLNKFDSRVYLFKLHNFDPSAKPSAVDMTDQQEEKSLGEFLAVYKLNGDDLELCWGRKNRARRARRSLKRARGGLCWC